MADAYATLANGGIHHDPTAISRVEFPNGKVDEPDADSGERVLTEGQAYEVTQILEGVITQGTGAGYTYMGCSAEAGKTGTSEGESDAWFVGYTPLYSTAVWVGHPQSREATGFGGPTAGPIWRSFMTAARGRRLPRIRSPVEPARTLRPRRANTPAPPRKPRPKRGERSGRNRKKTKGEKKEEGGGEGDEAGKAAKPAKTGTGPDAHPGPGPAPAPAPAPSEGVGGGVAAPTG